MFRLTYDIASNYCNYDKHIKKYILTYWIHLNTYICSATIDWTRKPIASLRALWWAHLGFSTSEITEAIQASTVVVQTCFNSYTSFNSYTTQHLFFLYRYRLQVATPYAVIKFFGAQPCKNDREASACRHPLPTHMVSSLSKSWPLNLSPWQPLTLSPWQPLNLSPWQPLNLSPWFWYWSSWPLQDSWVLQVWQVSTQPPKAFEHEGWWEFVSQRFGSGHWLEHWTPVQLGPRWRSPQVCRCSQESLWFPDFVFIYIYISSFS